MTAERAAAGVAAGRDTPGAVPTEAPGPERSSPPAFAWKSSSRFVEVYPVELGWLVLWGRYEERGRVRRLAGNRVYPDLAGVRARLLDAVLDLTNDGALAREAAILFDRTPFPRHPIKGIPEPL